MSNSRLMSPLATQDLIERAAHGLLTRHDLRTHLEHPSNQDPSEPLVIALLHELFPSLYVPKPLDLLTAP